MKEGGGLKKRLSDPAAPPITAAPEPVAALVVVDTGGSLVVVDTAELVLGTIIMVAESNSVDDTSVYSSETVCVCVCSMANLPIIVVDTESVAALEDISKLLVIGGMTI